MLSGKANPFRSVRRRKQRPGRAPLNPANETKTGKGKAMPCPTNIPANHKNEDHPCCP